jgi:hypothetical protein
MLEISIIVAVYTSCKLVFALLQIVTKNVEHDSANNRKSNDLKKKTSIMTNKVYYIPDKNRQSKDSNLQIVTKILPPYNRQQSTK